MKPRLTWLMVGIVMVSLASGLFSVLITKMSTEYGAPTDNTSLASYNKKEAISSNIQDIKDETTTIKEKTGALDILGAWFSNAYKILITAPQSVSLVQDMTDSAIEDSNLGEGGDIIKIALITILLILVFMGIILTVLLKTDVI